MSEEKAKRLFSKTLVWEMFQDEDLYDKLKGLTYEQLVEIVNAFMEKARLKLEDGTNVIFEGFGSFRIRHPNVKERTSFDVASKQVTTHKLHSRILFKAYFSIENEGDKS